MEPSSSMVYSAMMLSCRNRPSGSFFCRAYHFPAYCRQKQTGMRRRACLRCLRGPVGTHPLGVKVLFDLEAVHDAGGGQAAFHAGHQQQQQGHPGAFHPRSQISASAGANGALQTRVVHHRSEDLSAHTTSQEAKEELVPGVREAACLGSGAGLVFIRQSEFSHSGGPLYTLQADRLTADFHRSELNKVLKSTANPAGKKSSP